MDGSGRSLTDLTNRADRQFRLEAVKSGTSHNCTFWLVLFSVVDVSQMVVPAAGVEPATFRSGGERSNPLSYAGLNKLRTFQRGA